MNNFTRQVLLCFLLLLAANLSWAQDKKPDVPVTPPAAGADLRASIWSELKTQKSIDIFRRNLQKVFVEKVAALLSPKDPATISYVPPGQAYGFNVRRVDLKTTDLPSIVRGQMESLLSEIRAAIGAAPDKMSRYHLEDVANRIDSALHPK